MYNNVKFWAFAVVCFIASTIVYIVIDKSISFRVIFNAVLLITSVLGLFFMLKKQKNKNNKRNIY